MTAPAEVIVLIENFERNLEAYRGGKYNETQVRRDFIDPLFKALGWDMDNSLGYAEGYRDVIHEDAIKIGASTRAPDYSFRVGGQRKFFLEAKKPAVNVKEDVEPAFQLRRYAWSAKLPLSIVTDFEEFAIYDCRQKPNKDDKASKARLFYCTYRDYAEKWDEIAGIFSKDAVLKGSFDKYASTSKGKRGTSEVDSAFLAEIENWRDLLAHNIALRNANLSQRDLNFSVQQTIDRIIFLRICEDRGIEPYGKLMALQNGVNVYARLRQMFRDADDRYNSGLFHFSKEKNRAGAPDELTLHLEIDDKPLKEIFKNLYYPDSPYEFSVLGADILGSVYEQFLGKVIRLTSGSRAVVEDKPEVKKAGGVFYTPAYIVQYIVEHTIGKLLEGKSSKQAAGISILDPACGSGSFLIGAYQYLLDWYLERYVEEGAEKNSKGKAARIHAAAHGAWRLTSAEKKRILLEHIYGVDIDTQAVEVTKLSLLLKMLEGESNESLNNQMALFHERVLPDLDKNIQCGNSLIGPDFYDGQLDLDDETVQRINVFDWQAGFPHIHKAGGFDVVIGNPPYGASIDEKEKKYFKERYATQNYKYDTYVFFIERGISLLRNNGKLSFITPEVWTRLESGTSLRQFLSSNSALERFKFFGEGVFSAAVVSTCVFIANRSEKQSTINIETNLGSWKLNAAQWKATPNLVIDYKVSPAAASVISKLTLSSFRLSDLGEVIQGITAYDKYRGQPPDLIKNRAYHSPIKQDDTYGKWLEGKDVGRYQLSWSGEWLSYGPWLGAAREPRFFSGERLLFREVPGKERRIQVTLATETSYYGHSVTPFLLNGGCTFALRFILGIVNSRLISWYGEILLPNFGKDIFPKLNPQDIRLIPIKKLDISITENKQIHDKLVALVEKMLALHQQLATTKNPQDATLKQRQIDATDKQIDQLVYQLYGLSDEEIALVEGNV
ncbi:MAG: N-6 DNA methylase [Gallionellaceae bacterium]|jgi:type I restriction-modification system DNA methylase subunit/predicted type IV restriction endonuclease